MRNFKQLWQRIIKLCGSAQKLNIRDDSVSFHYFYSFIIYNAATWFPAFFLYANSQKNVQII